MADTVNLDNITEYNDEKTVLNESIIKLAGLVKSSKHFIVFTGAGISTSAGINDFRGPNGVWTCKAKGIPVQSGIPITQASPSYAHMALVKLMEEGVLKYVVSQNIDGLHRRSGIGKTHISELHGNCYREVCWSCDNEYLRTYDVGDKAPNRHRKCKGRQKEDPMYSSVHALLPSHP